MLREVQRTRTSYTARCARDQKWSDLGYAERTRSSLLAI